MAEVDVRAVLHELQVHQIELEMQNEELQRAGAVASEASDKYQDLFDFAPIGYFLFDGQSRILEVNLAGAALLGLDRSTAVKQRFAQSVAMEYRISFGDFCRRVLATEAKQSCELTLIKNGEAVHVLVEGIVAQDRRRPGQLCRATVTDITARKQAEETHHRLQQQLAHMARLSTMGEMLAGIAHELNQPLHSIMTFAKACSNVLSQDKARPEQLRQWNEAIAVAAERGGKIIRGLRAFLTKTEPPLVPTAVRAVIEESLSLLAFEIRDHRVTVLTQFDAVDLVVGIEPVQIQQVLVNLLQNACEALAETTKGARQVRIRTAAAGKFVEVSVADNGPGLEGCDVSKIFDPFFTTKPNGMGMGLAISRTIVEAHGGQIWTTPNPESGAVFHLTLPLAAKGLCDVQ
jgi:PAS domain S-box-containing protein